MNKDSSLTSLTAKQRQAFLDLVVLSMYVDGNLDSIEDRSIRRLLGTMGFETKYDQDREFDAAVTRIRPFVENSDTARRRAVDLVRNFGTGEEKRLIVGAVEDIISSDGQVSAKEAGFLEAIKKMLLSGDEAA